MAQMKVAEADSFVKKLGNGSSGGRSLQDVESLLMFLNHWEWTEQRSMIGDAREKVQGHKDLGKAIMEMDTSDE